MSSLKIKITPTQSYISSISKDNDIDYIDYLNEVLKDISKKKLYKSKIFLPLNNLNKKICELLLCIYSLL